MPWGTGVKPDWWRMRAKGFAIDVAECHGAGAIAFEGVGQFCGGLAHLFVGIIDSGFMADRLIERCQVLGFGGRV